MFLVSQLISWVIPRHPISADEIWQQSIDRDWIYFYWESIDLQICECFYILGIKFYFIINSTEVTISSMTIHKNPFFPLTHIWASYILCWVYKVVSTGLCLLCYFILLMWLTLLAFSSSSLNYLTWHKTLQLCPRFPKDKFEFLIDVYSSSF